MARFATHADQNVLRLLRDAGRLAAWALPSGIRAFVAGIDAILAAYRSRELTYSVLLAEKSA